MDGIENQKEFKDIINRIEGFMKRVDSIRHNVMDKENGLYVLELLHVKRMIKKELNSI